MWKRLRLWLLIKLGRYRTLQVESEGFWQDQDSSYLAESDFYLKRESVLSGLLQQFGPFEVGIDIGCGDGRFTEVISQFCEQTWGLDISRKFIADASGRESRVKYRVGGIESLAEYPKAHFVSCLGVITCFLDDQYFDEFLRVVKSRFELNGVLITSDTMSTTGEDILRVYRNGYFARHRCVSRYRSAFIQSGFRSVSEIEVADRGTGLMNYMFVWQAD